MDLREVTEFFRDFMWYIIAFFVIVIIFVFIVSFQPVAGNSMSPTLEEGQVVLVSKLSYLFSDIQRNEIVVVKKDAKSYIKRVIALPGEKVEYMNGLLYIDGTPYKETFLDESVITSNFLFIDICSENDCSDGVIPEDMYFVLGDNRPESEDSRTPEFGLVKRKEIKGKAFFKIWPLNNMGKVN